MVHQTWYVALMFDVSYLGQRVPHACSIPFSRLAFHLLPLVTPCLPQQHLTSQHPSLSTHLLNLPYGSGVSPYKPKMGKAPMSSSRLPEKLTTEDKPWLKQKEPREHWAYWLTLSMFIISLGTAAIIIWLGWTGVRQLKDDQLCLVLDDEFSSLDLKNTWTADNELSGFGNGEFEMMTDNSKNLYIKNSKLYIMPTLTSDDISASQVLNSGSLNVSDCTADTSASTYGVSSVENNCSATSNESNKQALPPVKSARISTKGHYSIQFGRVEVRAKLPCGDWLWPAIWMLPGDTNSSTSN